MASLLPIAEPPPALASSGPLSGWLSCYPLGHDLPWLYSMLPSPLHFTQGLGFTSTLFRLHIFVGPPVNARASVTISREGAFLPLSFQNLNFYLSLPRPA